MQNDNAKFKIIGLGNPGARYKNTRHNIGFMVLDELVSRNPEFKNRIIKPQTFMNRSGEAVRKIKDQQWVVLHDDIDLPLGTIRVRRGGSSGGHKGVQSIIDTLGSDEFVRVKIGVSRPPQGMEADEYVLKPFAKSEIGELKQVIDAAVNLVVNSLGDRKFEEETLQVKSDK
ncbi:aminoacyl-tRNA hydrolase [Candidatus Berkelbacteria bacterium]|nr:aminoacyl-tRNA hydrolase [Candidatus Berkelbacteria bacterium]